MTNRSARGTMYYMTHRSELLKVSREKHEVLKIDILTHYSTNNLPSCAWCGISDTDVLCIDHINDDGYEQRKNNPSRCGSGLYKWLRKNDYPEGYQVLCANCNLKKRLAKVREGIRGRTWR